MSKSLEKRIAKGVLTTTSASGAAGKGMTMAGVGGIGLTVLAGLVPFVGVLGLSVVLIILGLMLWE